eukprot:SAG31_NODE_4603_length_3099_cov_2.042971_5_plen_115_part_01
MEVISLISGVPLTKLNVTERGRLLAMDDNLRQRVVGQDAAVDAVAQAVLRSRAGLGRRTQPVGSFLFLGPTGVGKTELVHEPLERLLYFAARPPPPAPPPPPPCSSLSFSLLFFC